MNLCWKQHPLSWVSCPAREIGGCLCFICPTDTHHFHHLQGKSWRCILVAFAVKSGQLQKTIEDHELHAGQGSRKKSAHPPKTFWQNMLMMLMMMMMMTVMLFWREENPDDLEGHAVGWDASLLSVWDRALSTKEDDKSSSKDVKSSSSSSSSRRSSSSSTSSAINPAKQESSASQVAVNRKREEEEPHEDDIVKGQSRSRDLKNVISFGNHHLVPRRRGGAL